MFDVQLDGYDSADPDQGAELLRMGSDCLATLYGELRFPTWALPASPDLVTYTILVDEERLAGFVSLDTMAGEIELLHLEPGWCWSEVGVPVWATLSEEHGAALGFRPPRGRDVMVVAEKAGAPDARPCTALYRRMLRAAKARAAEVLVSCPHGRGGAWCNTCACAVAVADCTAALLDDRAARAHMAQLADGEAG